MNRSAPCRNRWRSSGIRWGIVLLLPILFLSAFGQETDVNTAKEATEATEEATVAALAYKFSSFTTWPEAAFNEPETPLVIGVFANKKMAAQMKEIAVEKTIHGRSIRVRLLKNPAEINGCHVLVCMDNKERCTNPAFSKRALQNNVLTIGTRNAFAKEGGCIEIQTEGKLAFRVNQTSLRQGKLELPSSVLVQASQVYKDK